MHTVQLAHHLDGMESALGWHALRNDSRIGGSGARLGVPVEDAMCRGSPGCPLWASEYEGDN